MPTCDFWRPEDLGKKVPDECCSIAAWPASVGFSTGGPDARTIVGDTSGKQPRCYARERVPAPGTFVRNFFGCYEGNLMAAEGCAPIGTSMGHGYPLPSADSAIENSVDGDPVSCNCDKPWYNQGPGCYVALSGFIAGVSPDPTANFLQVSGTCDATASLQQNVPSRTPASLQQTPPSLMSRSVVAPAPAPPSAFIQYYRVPNHADIAANMPTCDFWRPEDLGKKVPDECCSIAAWPASVGFSTGGPDARTVVGDTSGKQPRCYARERVPAPGTFVRNFFGCYEGNLMAAEGCAPVGTSMGHGYPLPSADSAIENSVDGDPVSCNCDKPWYNQGP